MRKQADQDLESQGLLSSTDDIDSGREFSPVAKSPHADRTAASSTEQSRRSGLLAAMLYGGTSITITFFNKAVFFVWHFDYPITISLMQVTSSLILFRLIGAHGTLQLPAISARILTVALPLAIFWCLNVLSGIFTLEYMSIPMFSTLRRLTTLIVLIGEHTLLRKYASRPVWASVLVMTTGALIAGVSDLEFNPIGYACVTINNLCTAGYLLLIQVTKSQLQVSNLQLLYLMNLCSFPFLLMAYLYFDSRAVFDYEHIKNWQFLLVLFCSCIQVMAFATFAARARTPSAQPSLPPALADLPIRARLAHHPPSVGVHLELRHVPVHDAQLRRDHLDHRADVQARDDDAWPFPLREHHVHDGQPDRALHRTHLELLVRMDQVLGDQKPVEAG